MGLKSAQYGVKADLARRVPDAFRECESLLAARREASVAREQTLVALDGNVLFRAVPRECARLHEYEHCVWRSIVSALGAGRAVVVVLDEPDALTPAKREEQWRRDARAGAGAVVCSADMGVPTDDAYDVETLERCASVHPLIANRATRARTFDELARRLLRRVEKQFLEWRAGGHDPGAFALDGVDAAGAERAAGSPRRAALVEAAGGSLELCPLLERARPIGEGDLKLRDIEARLAENAVGIRLLLLVTIDTDAIAVGLVEASRRALASPASTLGTLLCMRERAPDGGGRAAYRCLDLGMLREQLLTRVCAGVPDGRTAARATALLIAGWAASGCDFVEVKGMRASVALDALCALVRESPDALPAADALIEGRADRAAVSTAMGALRGLLEATAARLDAMPRLQRAAASVRAAPDDALRRVVWTTAYWHGIELDAAQFGFADRRTLASADLL